MIEHCEMGGEGDRKVKVGGQGSVIQPHELLAGDFSRLRCGILSHILITAFSKVRFGIFL
jgi:hypothetical protein